MASLSEIENSSQSQNQDEEVLAENLECKSNFLFILKGVPRYLRQMQKCHNRKPARDKITS